MQQQENDKRAREFALLMSKVDVIAWLQPCELHQLVVAQAAASRHSSSNEIFYTPLAKKLTRESAVTRFLMRNKMCLVHFSAVYIFLGLELEDWYKNHKQEVEKELDI